MLTGRASHRRRARPRRHPPPDAGSSEQEARNAPTLADVRDASIVYPSEVRSAGRMNALRRHGRRGAVDCDQRPGSGRTERLVAIVSGWLPDTPLRGGGNPARAGCDLPPRRLGCRFPPSTVSASSLWPPRFSSVLLGEPRVDALVRWWCQQPALASAPGVSSLRSLVRSSCTPRCPGLGPTGLLNWLRTSATVPGGADGLGEHLAPAAAPCVKTRNSSCPELRGAAMRFTRAGALSSSSACRRSPLGPRRSLGDVRRRRGDLLPQPARGAGGAPHSASSIASVTVGRSPRAAVRTTSVAQLWAH